MKALGGVRGDDVVSRTGSVITRMLADRTGLTSEMSDALIRPDVTHDRGAVMRDLAVAIADGASCMSEIAVLGDQSRVFGAVASTSTLWRTLNELDAKALQRLVQARNKVRAAVWALIAARHGAVPPVRTAYGDIDGVICIRLDATLITSYSDKDCAAGNFKGGWGFHPLTAWCDNTGELLAIIPRTGCAGSNTATDHIAIIDAAIDRGDPRQASASAVDHHRRSRIQPRRARPHQRAQRTQRLLGPLLGRLRPRQTGPQRDHPAARGCVVRRAGRRRESA